MRPLSAEERALWARVTASIRPLSRDKIEIEEQAEAPLAAAKAPAPRPPAAPPPRRIAPPTLRRHAIANNLDGGWDRRLKAGSVEPDRTLDLHGHNLNRAWTAIDQGLDQAIARGERVILLVTGHARPGEPPIVRGQIRAAVNDWLAVSRHAPRIAAVREAHRRHGGGGSLYIILRR